MCIDLDADSPETDETENETVSVFEDIADALRGLSEWGELSENSIKIIQMMAAGAFTIFAALQDGDARDQGDTSRDAPRLAADECRTIAELFADFVDTCTVLRDDRSRRRHLLNGAAGLLATVSPLNVKTATLDTAA
ncbi:hypothetical protein FRACA_170043 [Frankia canadensis]|uniref:Uncharacterized protein n=1 Tax=Frankia canadensis TaxID=1836972 RepID=A0A2I2KN40_9ACTN|nr:hypothetical protein [Frankia canadensis]SNQ47083.1 hypothetical protein FRACA_170043 [Frankia canadensis]SOU54373.1 hypothetical protein FRACA_170043 [Frankia canadensis]